MPCFFSDADLVDLLRNERSFCMLWVLFIAIFLKLYVGVTAKIRNGKFGRLETPHDMWPQDKNLCPTGNIIAF